RLVERREDVPLIRSTIADMRLQAPRIREDLETLSAANSGPGTQRAAELVAAIGRDADSVPQRLFGYHFAREAMLNVHRYLATKLRAAWVEPDQREGYRFLDPHGIGQRPLWERFCRNLDKHRLSEPERVSVAEASGMMFDLATEIAGDLGSAPEGEPRRVPISI
ncbi:MAG: hypothetical protein AAF235_10910, partial [Planctomycetota bacterium]